MEFKPGELIFNGKYRIERELGRGAFGLVYLAKHQTLETWVAIKTLHKDAPNVGSSAYSNYRARFWQEAKLSARIKHPQVLRVFDFAEHDDTLMTLMDYAPGGSVADLIRTHGALPIPQIVQILRDSAAGLNAIHEAEAVHRDVKPSNILLDGRGHAMIADLGLAQLGSITTSRDSRDASMSLPHPGTPSYMSPEHANGSEPLAPTSDVYSLGCVAFEMLTGKQWKSERRRVREVREARADTPAWLNNLVTRMLKQPPALEYNDANDTTKRYIDCQALLTAMDEADRVEQAEAERQRQAAEHAAETERQRHAQEQAVAEAETKRKAEAETRARQERERAQAEAEAKRLTLPQSTRASVTPPNLPPKTRNWYGYKFGFPGSSLGFIALFLPWVLHGCGSDSPASSRGWELTLIGLEGIDRMFTSSFDVFYLIWSLSILFTISPIVGVGLSLTFIHRKYILSKMDFIGLFISGFLALSSVVILAIHQVGLDKAIPFILGIKVVIESSGSGLFATSKSYYQGQYGLLLAIAAYILMMIGGIINWRSFRELRNSKTIHVKGVVTSHGD
ncbi:MAG: protein kinase [Anaerolineae bacterium]|nr:protein kinase [Anaerolineae bacterium]